MVPSRLFIGSSAEQIPLLNEIQKLIGNDVEIIPWTKAFALNKSALDSLIKQTRLSDFAILIATKDDLVKKRDKEVLSPRDNVIFEFGLFLGAVGTERCFLLAEEGTELPSDLGGINVSTFTLVLGKYNSLPLIVEQINKQIQAVSKKSELGLLPSTALAIGYYNGFLKRLFDEVQRHRTIIIDDKVTQVKSFKLTVIIPDVLDDNGVGDFTKLYNHSHQLRKASTFVELAGNGQGRGYPFHFKVDPPEQDLTQPLEIHVSDVPTTLDTIKEALKLYLPANGVGHDFDLEHLERRELQKFADVLKFLVGRNSLTRSNVIVESEVKL